jgi:hypothetical protein
LITFRRVNFDLAGSLARELAWKTRSAFIPPAVEPPSWTVDRSVLARCEISWPKTYDWPYAGKWVDPLYRGFLRLVRVRRAEIDQPFRHVVLFQLHVAGQTHGVAIDYADRPEISDECAMQVLLYFKMQHRAAGYPFRNIVPGGFLPAAQLLYGYLPLFRRVRDSGDFRYEVYGRFSTEFAEAGRKKAIDLLLQQQLFKYEGGLKRVRYSTFLHEAARSKICIDLPGNGDFCFRLLDYLSLGSCVIAAPHGNILHAPLRHRETIVYTKPDLSDLVELCDYYLCHGEERERIAANARKFFDRYLSRDQLVNYYLSTLLGRACLLGAPPRGETVAAVEARQSVRRVSSAEA